MTMMRPSSRILVALSLVLLPKTAQAQLPAGLLDDLDLDLPDGLNETLANLDIDTEAYVTDALDSVCDQLGATTFAVDDNIDVTCSCSSANTTDASSIAAGQDAQVAFSCSADDLCTLGDSDLLNFCVSFVYNGAATVASDDLVALLQEANNTLASTAFDNITLDDINITLPTVDDLPVTVTSNSNFKLTTYILGIPISYDIDIVYVHNESKPLQIIDCTAVVPGISNDCECTPCDGLPIPSLGCINFPCLI